MPLAAMRLPGNAVGPTDIQAYRECPRRFAFGMRRHTDAGEHPEAQGPATAYGSAIHEAIACAERNEATDADAVQRAFDLYCRWLEPDDLRRLHDDLRTYRERDYLGVRTVAVERELRIPLFELDGETIYLRTRIDRLYQRLDNPAVFVHVDYKSSKWPLTQAEVDENLQMWLTNLIVHEHWPECERLVQVYDQLNFGALTTRKSDEQRALVREWAVRQIRTIMADEKLEPTKNRWCPWCPIMESCPVVSQLSEYATAELAALAPEHKEGRKTVIDLDPTMFEAYVEELDDVALALKVLRRYDETVRGALRDMTDTRRRELGYRLAERTRTTFPPEALRAAHEVLGDDFYEVIGLTKAAVERLGDERSGAILDMAVIAPTTPAVQKAKGG